MLVCRVDESALSHLIGLTLLDTLIGVQHPSDLSDGELVALVEPAISRYIAPSEADHRI